MITRSVLVPAVAMVFAFTACEAPRQAESVATADFEAHAYRIAHTTLILDAHLDVPYRLSVRMVDISERTFTTDFDFPRAREGGLDAAYAAVYTPQSLETTGGARAHALQQIALVEGLAARWPHRFALARTEADIRRNMTRGLVSFILCMENGIPLEGDVRAVRDFFDRGIRYITLVHAKSNQLGDASYDLDRPWNGLSPFGRQVVAEMNAVGMMVDVSHMSDSAFTQTLRLSRAPVVASHSACRTYTPGWERNMSDDMIRALAARGGVLQINFGSSFLVDSIRTAMADAGPAVSRYLRDHSLNSLDREAVDYARAFRKEAGIPYADVSDVARHIDHVVQLVGVDYVGFGSDFEGLGDDLPNGLKDVSGYPAIIRELLRLGYSDEQIAKICSGNHLRVWHAVERVAGELKKEP